MSRIPKSNNFSYINGSLFDYYFEGTNLGISVVSFKSVTCISCIYIYIYIFFPLCVNMVWHYSIKKHI